MMCTTLTLASVAAMICKPFPGHAGDKGTNVAFSIQQLEGESTVFIIQSYHGEWSGIARSDLPNEVRVSRNGLQEGEMVPKENRYSATCNRIQVQIAPIRIIAQEKAYASFYSRIYVNTGAPVDEGDTPHKTPHSRAGSHSARVMWIGPGHVAELTENGLSRSGTSLDPTEVWNRYPAAFREKKGSASSVIIFQKGSYCLARADQFGPGHTALLEQAGSGHYAIITQRTTADAS